MGIEVMPSEDGSADRFKVIATVTWMFDKESNGDTLEDVLKLAREQLEGILDCSPYGDDYQGFSVQVDIAKMKSKNRLRHLGEFSLDEVLPFATVENVRKEYSIGNKIYSVRMNSQRYLVFRDNHKCVSCGLEGSKMMLDTNGHEHSPHFNMYAVENGRLVLMTKDHVLAKSRGGKDSLTNYVTMCSICNNLKAHYDLTHEQIKQLRDIYRNDAKLSRKEVRDALNKARASMTGNILCLTSV